MLKVKVDGEIEHTAADGNESWSTIGVSENIIEASWEALRDSFNYRLFKIQNSKKELSLIDA